MQLQAEETKWETPAVKRSSGEEGRREELYQEGRREEHYQEGRREEHYQEGRREEHYQDLVNKSDSEKVLARRLGPGPPAEDLERMLAARGREVARLEELLEARAGEGELELRQTRHQLALAQAESHQAKLEAAQLNQVGTGLVLAVHCTRCTRCTVQCSGHLETVTTDYHHPAILRCHTSLEKLDFIHTVINVSLYTAHFFHIYPAPDGASQC